MKLDQGVNKVIDVQPNEEDSLVIKLKSSSYVENQNSIKDNWGELTQNLDILKDRNMFEQSKDNMKQGELGPPQFTSSGKLKPRSAVGLLDLGVLNFTNQVDIIKKEEKIP